jgi:hypothetical protein
MPSEQSHGNSPIGYRSADLMLPTIWYGTLLKVRGNAALSFNQHFLGKPANISGVAMFKVFVRTSLHPSKSENCGCHCNVAAGVTADVASDVTADVTSDVTADVTSGVFVLRNVLIEGAKIYLMCLRG